MVKVMGYLAMLENAADLYNSSASLMSESYRGGVSLSPDRNQQGNMNMLRQYDAIVLSFFCFMAG